MSKHTAGGWFDWKAPHENSVTGPQEKDGSFPIIAIVRGKRKDADARLMSIAPDLYERSQFLIDRLTEFESNLKDDEFATEFFGHVSPAMARLKLAIANLDRT